MSLEHHTVVKEALDCAVNAEGSRETDFRNPRNQHKRDTVRRLLLRVVSELPEDMTVTEIRDALEE